MTIKKTSKDPKTPIMDEIVESVSKSQPQEASPTPSGLNPRQEAFARLYADMDRFFFGNGVQCYIEVYKPDQTKKGWYKVACSRANQLLSNVEVCARINNLLEEGGFNNQFMDKQLTFLATQHEDKSAKLGAIREYNRIVKRVEEKTGPTIVIAGDLWKDIVAGSSKT